MLCAPFASLCFTQYFRRKEIGSRGWKDKVGREKPIEYSIKTLPKCSPHPPILLFAFMEKRIGGGIEKRRHAPRLEASPSM